jgi:hypothetical protein
MTAMLPQLVRWRPAVKQLTHELQHETFGHQHVLAKLSVGPMPHNIVMRAIELPGTEFALRVLEAIKEPAAVR